MVTHRILVVDDEPVLLKLMVRALQEQGYTIIAAGHAEKALEICRSSPEGFDLVITDNRMPHLSGLELVRCLREMNPTQRILHVSGGPRGEPVEGLPRNVPTLHKPFRTPELIRAVRNLLST